MARRIEPTSVPPTSPRRGRRLRRISTCFVGVGLLLTLCVPQQGIAQYISGPAAGAGARPGPTPPSMYGMSLEELTASLERGKLSSEQVSQISAAALHNQADPAADWDPRWGDFVEMAHEKGQLSDGLWMKYLLGAVVMSARVTLETTRAEGLTVDYQFGKWRTGSHPGDILLRGRREDEFSGIKLDPYRNTGYSVVYNVIGPEGGMGWTEPLSEAGYSTLKPGLQTYHYRYHVELLDSDTPYDKIAQAKPLGDRVIEGTLVWTLLPDKQPPTPPSLKADEAMRPAVQACLRAQALRDTRDTSLVEVMIQVDHPAVGMGFQVSSKILGQEDPLGTVAWVAGNFGGSWWAFDIDVPPEVRTLCLILRSDAAAAGLLKRENPQRLMGLDSIWAGDVSLDDIPITSQRVEAMAIWPPDSEFAREEELPELVGDDPAILQVKRGGEIVTALTELKRTVQQKPDDQTALFNLGCLTVADGDWQHASNYFVRVLQVSPASPLAKQAHRQMRRIQSYFVSQAGDRDAAAMYGLGLIYEQGTGAKIDRQQAKRWYRNAANAGNADAMCRLAAMYEEDLAAGVSKPAAVEWYRSQVIEFYHKAANLGNEEAKQWVTAHDRQ
jgi:hypothetical protein